MSDRRRWVARFLVLVFSAAELFASAPQLHGHDTSLNAAAIATRSSAGSSLARPHALAPAPDECMACQISNLVMTIHSGLSISAPTENTHHRLLAPSLVAFAATPHTAFGRAPPAV